MSKTRTEVHTIESTLISSVKHLLESNAEFDIIFVTSEKHQIKAHQIILSLFSKFFRDLFSTSLNHFTHQVIILPNYSSEVVSSFIQFFYTGEVLIHEKLLPEFVSICKEFKCDEIPSLSEILNSKVDDQIKIEPQSQTINQFLEISDVVQEDTESHVESIFFKVVTNDEVSPTNDELNVANVKEEYLNEEYIEENPQYEFMEVLDKRMSDDDQFTLDQSQNEPIDWPSDRVEELRKPNERKTKNSAIKKEKKSSISFPINLINIKQLREEQEKFKKRLQEAVNSVRDNINTVKKAAKLFDVPTSAIERNLKSYKSNEKV